MLHLKRIVTYAVSLCKWLIHKYSMFRTLPFRQEFMHNLFMSWFNLYFRSPKVFNRICMVKLFITNIHPTFRLSNKRLVIDCLNRKMLTEDHDCSLIAWNGDFCQHCQGKVQTTLFSIANKYKGGGPFWAIGLFPLCSPKAWRFSYLDDCGWLAPSKPSLHSFWKSWDLLNFLTLQNYHSDILFPSSGISTQVSRHFFERLWQSLGGPIFFRGVNPPHSAQPWRLGCPDTPTVRRSFCSLSLHFCWLGQYLRVIREGYRHLLLALFQPGRSWFPQLRRMCRSVAWCLPYRRNGLSTLGGLLSGGTASQAFESGSPLGGLLSRCHWVTKVFLEGLKAWCGLSSSTVRGSTASATKFVCWISWEFTAINHHILKTMPLRCRQNVRPPELLMRSWEETSIHSLIPII